VKPAGVFPEAASASFHRLDGAASPAAKIVLLGASGYAGQEFARLALEHPGVRLSALISREHAGSSAEKLLAGRDGRSAVSDPKADGRSSLPPVLGVEALADLLASRSCDTIVSSLPHGAWAPLEAELSKTPAIASALAACRIIDLSSDHRDGSSGYLYGLPEAFRPAIAGASRLANPGCYPTATALALLPVAASGFIDGPVMVTALSGVSGAGRAPALRTSFVELDGGASFYKVGTVHQHVREMERTLALLGGTAIPVGFAPQLVPMSRGILLTATARLARALSPHAARRLYNDSYEREPFVRLLPEGEWPDTRLVRNSNRCDVQVTTLHGGRELVACAAIDNLVKGAAGQAIQNLNLMLGLPETTGLPRHGSPW
jgi:N-acetyl-gamma-glutamyl-phosphate reductase